MTEILVGINGTAGAESALAFAKQFARLTGAGLRLANVFPYDDTPSRASNAGFREALLEDAEALLAGADAGDAPRHAIADVSPAHALHEIAERHGCSLVVVGSTDRGRLGRVLPGSTGERLLHGAPCPVAIVPHGYAAHPLLTVGVGYDGSDESEAAVTSAYEIARRLGARLRVIGVFDATQVGTPALMTGPSYTAIHKELEEMQRTALLRRVAGLGEDVGIESVFLTGTPSRELAERSESVDLMVMGSRGYGPMRAVLLGGVSHGLVHKAACPVLILPRGAKAGLQPLLAAAVEANA
jgi:nucleotide-binding universal stress UspA family protein